MTIVVFENKDSAFAEYEKDCYVSHRTVAEDGPVKVAIGHMQDSKGEAAPSASVYFSPQHGESIVAYFKGEVYEKLLCLLGDKKELLEAAFGYLLPLLEPDHIQQMITFAYKLGRERGRESHRREVRKQLRDLIGI